jgi:lipopolysaccharide export system permease protein
MLGVGVLNQEFIIPLLADRLNYDRDDFTGEKEQTVRGQYEPNLIHLAGEKASRKNLSVRKFHVAIPESISGRPWNITATEARFVRRDKNNYVWEMTGCFPAELEGWDKPEYLEVKDVGRFRLHTRHVDYEALTRNPGWYLLTSTAKLYQELQEPETSRLGSVAVQFQMRITRPLLGLLLVLMGVSMILRDQNRNVIVSAGSCLVLCGLFFAVCYCARMLGDSDILSPALSAWLPVILFGPFALVLFDAVHT